VFAAVACVIMHPAAAGHVMIVYFLFIQLSIDFVI
jgi:hypothetical protein